MFNEVQENVHDEAQSGRPSLVNADLVRKVNERVRDDRRFTISDLSCTFLRFQGLYTVTLSVVVWVIGKCVHDGCTRRSQRSTKNSVVYVLLHFWCAITRKETAFWAICDSRWDMGVPYHTWIKTAVLALEAYWLAEKEKVQADVFNKKYHVHHILGQTRYSLGRIFAPRHKLCSLLWKAEEASQPQIWEAVADACLHLSHLWLYTSSSLNWYPFQECTVSNPVIVLRWFLLKLSNSPAL